MGTGRRGVYYMKEQCPKCGNWVEGKRIQSYTKKVAKTGVKSLVNGAASVGATGTGAAIGSAILPGIGTIIGGAAGFIASSMFHTAVNEGIDKVADGTEGLLADLEYEFTCPKCGRYWKRTSSSNESSGQTRVTNSTSTIGTKQKLFNKEFYYYLENTDGIIETKEKAQKYLREISDKMPHGDITVESEYLFLKAIVCLDYSLQNEDDNSLVGLGHYFINSAISILKDDGEYKLVKLMFESLIVKHDALDVVFIQQKIQGRCPSIHLLENTLFKNEYLKELYEKTRFYSLIDSAAALENREDFKGAAKCLEMMTQLSDSGYKLCAYEVLMDYYYFGRKGLNVSKELGFKYAQKGYELADFTNEFNPEVSYQARWLRCLERIAYAYLESEGTNQDYQKAFELTTKAANLGGMYSAYNLGEIYELGRGVAINKVLALEWYEKALELGLEGAKEKINQLRGTTSTSVQTQMLNSNVSEDEQEYLEEVKMCLEEDNEISPKERRLLDRLRIKLNISEERAKELEESLKAPQLTENEQEYLEEYKLCLEEDGEISSKERRLLDRLRDKLGISVERAKELENNYK